MCTEKGSGWRLRYPAEMMAMVQKLLVALADHAVATIADYSEVAVFPAGWQQIPALRP